MASEEDLTTAAVAATRLGLAADDAGLPGLITAASEALANVVGYPLHLREELVESCVGGGQRLFLKAGAIRVVDMVVCYGAEREPSTFTVEDEVKGVLLSFRGPWPFTGRTGGGVSEGPVFREDTGDVLVSFSAGWVTPGQAALDGTLTRDLPALMEEACLLTLQAWPRAGNPNIRSRATGNASVSYGDGVDRGVPPAARALVARYVKHVR
jgi:hypothetical protein